MDPLGSVSPKLMRGASFCHQAFMIALLDGRGKGRPARSVLSRTSIGRKNTITFKHDPDLCTITDSLGGS
jgi:hypothetical protein